MDVTEHYFKAFLAQHKLNVSDVNQALFNEFVTDGTIINAVNVILENQKMMKDKWIIRNTINDIVNQAVVLPNGTVGKWYDSAFDFIKLGWNEIVFFEFQGLEEIGLEFNHNKENISGVPKSNGDFKIKFLFRVNGELENSTLNEKIIRLIINHDPKTLWKNLPSDSNDAYWKEDNAAVAASFSDKKIVAASKRGRSHANVGSFREDDFEIKNFEKTGWSLIAVSDGAGSASISRKGSRLACEKIIAYFETHLTEEFSAKIDDLFFVHHANSSDETMSVIQKFTVSRLSPAVEYAYLQIQEFALHSGKTLQDFHATLIFVLMKKYEFGYGLMSFGVGDCPIGLLNKEVTEINLLNTLDVGEFGGGTRFVTMPEIFENEDFNTRFNAVFIKDISYLMLMTDGIYDPKFSVEANLENIDKWKDFLKDLKGQNPDGIALDFETDNPDIADKLSDWMDFWSAGNHDDRTLAIIY